MENVITEAPIVHGEISVGHFTVSSSLTFGDGSSINAVDNTLDASSTNPLTNSATTMAINNVNAPPVSNFYVHLVMNPSATHSSVGEVTFAGRETFLNTFNYGGPNATDSHIIIPVSGTYHVASTTIALIQSNSIDMTIKKNNNDLKAHSGYGTVSTGGTFFFEKADIVTLHSNSAVHGRSELAVTLLRADQTI